MNNLPQRFDLSARKGAALGPIEVVVSGIDLTLYNLTGTPDTLTVTLAGGDPDETISSRAAKAAARGRRWGCVLCRVLDRIDPGHCANNTERDEGERTHGKP